MKVEKLTDELKEEKSQEGELPKKSVRKREDMQLFWFFVIISIIFMSFLGPYFYIQDLKKFEYAHATWTIEDYENLRIYHGRFPQAVNPSITFNTYLRTDPRKNDIETLGNFVNFRSKAVISMSPEVDKCRGELSRVMLDLGSFLREGIGIPNLESGSTDELVADKTSRKYATCKKTTYETVIVIELGNESKIIQDETNKECYTIYATNCQDLTSVEKFIVKTTDDIGIKLDKAREEAKAK